MKNPKHELFGRMQRQYHQEHSWRLSREGLYIPHSYEEKQPDDLSWWDDVGFIVNGRRVVVWWQPPRDVYRAAIDEQSWLEAGPGRDQTTAGCLTARPRTTSGSGLRVRNWSAIHLAAPPMRRRRASRISKGSESG
jgi:hypothetical protein